MYLVGFVLFIKMFIYRIYHSCIFVSSCYNHSVFRYSHTTHNCDKCMPCNISNI